MLLIVALLPGLAGEVRRGAGGRRAEGEFAWMVAGGMLLRIA
jgi:hypothetical protein